MIDRAGAVVERYAYDSYGRPRIRESAGRGDMNNNTLMTSTDTSRFTDAKNAAIWDPRADMDAERARGGSVKGDVDSNDRTLYDAKQPGWATALDAPTVAQAFSDVDNPYMFQGVPHFALDTANNATEDKLSLNHHRARFADCMTGRWITRDPLFYLANSLSQLLTDLGEKQLVSRLERDGLTWRFSILTILREHKDTKHSLFRQHKAAPISTDLDRQSRILNAPFLFETLESNPTTRFDWNGLVPCFPAPGTNWCGPGYSGGLCDGQAGPPAPPVNAVDAICMEHDYCFSWEEGAASNNECCNKALCSSLNGLIGQDRCTDLWKNMCRVFNCNCCMAGCR